MSTSTKKPIGFLRVYFGLPRSKYETSPCNKYVFPHILNKMYI